MEHAPAPPPGPGAPPGEAAAAGTAALPAGESDDAFMKDLLALPICAPCRFEAPSDDDNDAGKDPGGEDRSGGGDGKDPAGEDGEDSDGEDSAGEDSAGGGGGAPGGSGGRSSSRRRKPGLCGRLRSAVADGALDVVILVWRLLMHLGELCEVVFGLGAAAGSEIVRLPGPVHIAPPGGAEVAVEHARVVTLTGTGAAGRALRRFYRENADPDGAAWSEFMRRWDLGAVPPHYVIPVFGSPEAKPPRLHSHWVAVSVTAEDDADAVVLSRANRGVDSLTRPLARGVGRLDSILAAHFAPGEDLASRRRRHLRLLLGLGQPEAPAEAGAPAGPPAEAEDEDAAAAAAEGEAAAAEGGAAAGGDAAAGGEDAAAAKGEATGEHAAASEGEDAASGGEGGEAAAGGGEGGEDAASGGEGGEAAAGGGEGGEAAASGGEGGEAAASGGEEGAAAEGEDAASGGEEGAAACRRRRIRTRVRS